MAERLAGVYVPDLLEVLASKVLYGWYLKEQSNMKAQLQTIRILLVDDDVFFRERFACLLAAELDFEVIGQCESVVKALRILSSTPVDLVVLGIDLNTRRGFRF